jgi:hypothetical protein
MSALYQRIALTTNVASLCFAVSPRFPTSCCTGALRPYRVIDDYDASCREDPSQLARSLYVILKDERLLELDPQETLMACLQKHRQFRLANAKLMTHRTPGLAGLSVPLLARFFELVSMCEVPYGKSSQVCSGQLNKYQVL